MSQRKLTKFTQSDQAVTWLCGNFRKARWEKLGLEPTLENWQDRTSGDRVFQTLLILKGWKTELTSLIDPSHSVWSMCIFFEFFFYLKLICFLVKAMTFWRSQEVRCYIFFCPIIYPPAQNCAHRNFGGLFFVPIYSLLVLQGYYWTKFKLYTKLALSILDVILFINFLTEFPQHMAKKSHSSMVLSV